MMLKLNEQIRNLDRLMKKKGYTGKFLCDSEHSGVLNESITKHLTKNWRSDAFIAPFTLTTHSDCKSNKEQHMQFDFRIIHNHNEGFCIAMMNLRLSSGANPIKIIGYNLERSADIPSLTTAKVLLGDTQEQKQNKGMKF